MMDLAEARAVVWDEPGWLAGVGRALGELLPRLSPALPVWEPCRVLEVGCGVGRVLYPLAAALPEAVCYGVDASPAMVRQARAVRDSLGVHAWVHANDGATLPFSGDFKFDAVFSLSVFQHIPDDVCQGYVTEMCRILKPGGVAVVQWVQGDHHDGMDHRRHVVTVEEWWPEGVQVTSEQDRFQREWWWTTATKLWDVDSSLVDEDIDG